MKVFYRYKRFFIALAVELVLFSFLLVLTYYHGKQIEEQLQRTASLSQGLGLTDLSLWSAARYARNPVLADRFNPFQDFPGSIEHFPEGSIIPPPQHLRR
jgi:hypothetical protein